MSIITYFNGDHHHLIYHFVPIVKLTLKFPEILRPLAFFNSLPKGEGKNEHEMGRHHIEWKKGEKILFNQRLMRYTPSCNLF